MLVDLSQLFFGTFDVIKCRLSVLVDTANKCLMLSDDCAKLLEQLRNVLQGIFDLSDGAATVLMPRILHRLLIMPTLLVLINKAACVHVLGIDILLRLDLDPSPHIDTFLWATARFVSLVARADQPLTLGLLCLNHLLVLLQTILERTGQLGSSVLYDL